MKILNDEMQCDVIKIGGLVRNKVSFSHMPLKVSALRACWLSPELQLSCADATICNVYLLVHRRNS